MPELPDYLQGIYDTPVAMNMNLRVLETIEIAPDILAAKVRLGYSPQNVLFYDPLHYPNRRSQRLLRGTMNEHLTPTVRMLYSRKSLEELVNLGRELVRAREIQDLPVYPRQKLEVVSCSPSPQSF